MYNSKDKDVTIRILTRALYTLNDATLKLLNMNQPPSATIYLGFIEPYSNIFVHVCSKGISFYYIRNPTVAFHLPIIGNEKSNNYTEENYWLNMGGVHGKGKLFLFPKGSNKTIRNPDANINLYYKIYDQKNYFLIEDPFIGHDLDVKIEVDEKYKDLDAHLASPLYLLYHNDNFTENRNNSFIEFSNYATNHNSIRNHLIFIEKDNIKFSYNDANYFIRKIPNFNLPILRELRGVNMVTSMMNKNITSKNNYLFTFSVIDGISEVEVFIVSDVVSWIKRIQLIEIVKDGFKVTPECSVVNYLDWVSVFIVHAQKETDEGLQNKFYFYKIDEMNIRMFKSLLANPAETQGFTAARNIRVQNNLLYIIYDGFDYFNIMNIRPDKDSFLQKVFNRSI